MTGYQSKKDMAQDKLAQPEQEPVAWAVYDKRGGSKSLHWPEQHSPDGDANMFNAVPLVPQRPWVGLMDEEAQWLYDNCRTPSNLIDMVEARLKDKNNG